MFFSKNRKLWKPICKQECWQNGKRKAIGKLRWRKCERQKNGQRKQLRDRDREREQWRKIENNEIECLKENPDSE